MTPLLQRLSMLRQQAGAAAPAPVKPQQIPLASLALQRLFERRTQLQQRAPVDRSLPGVEIAPGLRLIERRFPEHISPVTINAAFARFGRFERTELLHFDTETTGLSGGAGTRAFMIGAADWNQGQLRLRQLCLTTMGAEPAMLEIFAQWLSEKSVLVSYNGRSFDAPLLKARYRLSRLVEPLSALRHLDLLFPTRRRFSGRWENCRLCTIERNVLQVVRIDDLPGSEAPRAWRDYLRGESARDFCRVIEHNAQDLLSLSGLLTHLTVQEAFVLQ
jgi:uncharacterized protein